MHVPTSLYQLAKKFNSLPDEKWDFVGALCGDEGSGKSSLAFSLATTIAHLRFGLSTQRTDDMKKVIDEYFLLNPLAKYVEEKVTNLPHYSPVVLDEAVQTADKHYWNTSEQKHLKKFFTTCRKRFKFVFMCIPDLFELAPYYRNNRVKWWLQILARDYKKKIGIAAVCVRRPISLGLDPWGQGQMQKILESFYKRTDSEEWGELDELKEVAKKWPNFVQFVHFSTIPPKVEKYYDAKVTDMKEEFVDLPPKEKVRRAELIASTYIKRELESGKTFRQLAAEHKVSTATLLALSKV